MALAQRMAVLLALLGLGIAARRVGLLEERRRDLLNAVAFYVALPALVFASTLERDLAALVSPELVAALWIVLAVVVCAAWVVHRRAETRGIRSVATVQSYHGNFGYLGLPLVAATLGEVAAASATIVLGVGALTQIPVTISLLVAMNDADASIRHEVRSLVGNPVLVSLGIALVVSVLGLAVPAPLVTGFDAVSQLALPLALLLVGSSIELRLPSERLDTVGAVLGLKLLVMPVVAWLAFTGLGVEPIARDAATVMFGAPAAVSTFVYAKALGGDAEFASVGVFTSTVASVATLGVLLQVVT